MCHMTGVQIAVCMFIYFYTISQVKKNDYVFDTHTSTHVDINEDKRNSISFDIYLLGIK